VHIAIAVNYSNANISCSANDSKFSTLDAFNDICAEKIYIFCVRELEEKRNGERERETQTDGNEGNRYYHI
jgi:hypothetical protein